MTAVVLFLLMFAGGIAVAVQPSINGRLAARAGILESACISFAVGTLALFLLLLLSGRGTVRGFSGAAWWEWTGGLFGAFFVTMTIVEVPRIGTAAALAATIAAQLATGLLLDRYGAFGFRGAPLSLSRIAGVLMLLVGAALVARR
jgi:transporter family-2 protein